MRIETKAKIKVIAMVKLEQKNMTRRQREHKVNTRILPKARENGGFHVAGRSHFESDWLRGWHEFDQSHSKVK